MTKGHCAWFLTAFMLVYPVPSSAYSSLPHPALAWHSHLLELPIDATTNFTQLIGLWMQTALNRLKLMIKKEADNHQFLTIQSWSLNKPCMKVDGSFLMISAFWILSFLEALFIRYWVQICNIGRYEQDGYNENPMKVPFSHIILLVHPACESIHTL